MNHKRLFLGLLFGIAAFVVYLFYYDTLIPGLIGGSYRLTNPAGFIISCFLLAGGQVIIGGFLLNVMAGAAGKKMDILKGDFIASITALLFAFTYVFFPRYGPFYYVVYTAGQGPWYAIPFELFWSAVIILCTAVLMKKQYQLPAKHAVLFSGIVYIFMTVGAS